MFDRRLWVPCRDTVAAGLAFGMFFSMILVLPLQMLFAGVLAMRFRVNVPFAMLGCWSSNMLTNGPIALGQVWLGDWMRRSLGFKVPGFEGIETVFLGMNFNAASFILGMVVSGVLMALLSYPLVHILSKIMPHHLPVMKNRVSGVRVRPVSPEL